MNQKVDRESVLFSLKYYEHRSKLKVRHNRTLIGYKIKLHIRWLSAVVASVLDS